MKLTTNFRVSIVASNLSSDRVDALSTAVSVARLGMAVRYDEDRIASLSSQIKKLEESEELSEVQKLDLSKKRLELSALQEEKSALESELSEGRSVYESVVESIVAEGNVRENVETLLRVISLDGNQFLAKYALTSDEFKDDLMTTLTKIATSARWNSKTGAPVLNSEERSVYKSALKHLKNIVRQSFSLSADSAYLKRTMINVSADELGLLVQTFVRDFTVKRSKNEDGVVSVVYDKTLRDWTSLRAQIVKIVLKRTMKAC